MLDIIYTMYSIKLIWHKKGQGLGGEGLGGEGLGGEGLGGEIGVLGKNRRVRKE